jgi:hypothetical protein
MRMSANEEKKNRNFIRGYSRSFDDKKRRSYSMTDIC